MNLRLVLAGIGLVSCVVLAVLLVYFDAVLLGLVAAGFAGVALVDLVVVQLRRRQRRRAEPRRHSAFE